MDLITYALAKKYTDDSIEGGGAVKGKNCTISSIEPIEGGNRVTFQWTLDNGVIETETMDVMDGEDGADGSQVTASETNGNIVVDGIEVTVYSDTEIKNDIDAINDIISTDEVTIEGNPLNFTTLSAQKSKSTILSVEPIQDLHGYDKPWVGGAGKNKFSSVLEQGSIQAADGQNTEPRNNRIRTKDYISINSSTRYTLSSSDANVLGYIFFYDSNGGYIGGGVGFESLPKTYYIDANTKNIKFAFKYSNDANINASGTFNFQLEENTSATSYEPYTNICPISGRTEIGILGCGKNIVNPIGVTDTINDVVFTMNSDGSVKVTETASALTVFKAGKFSIKKGTSYTLNGCPANGGSNSYRLDIRTSGASGYNNWIDNGSGGTYTATEDIEIFVFIRVASGYAFPTGGLTFYPMVRLASNTDSTFEPYKKNTDLTISLGQTVYGCRHDVENGVLVADYELREIKDEDITSVSFDYDYVARIATSLQWEANNGYKTNGCCNKYSLASNYDDVRFNNSKLGFNSSRDTLLVHDNNFVDANAVHTSILNTPIQVAYPLLNPIEISLDAHQISLLKGVNNISTDGDKITLTYRDGSVATLEDVLKVSDNLEQEISDSKILTDTATGTKYRLVVTDGVLGIEEVTEPNNVSLLSAPALLSTPVDEPSDETETVTESTEEV